MNNLLCENHLPRFNLKQEKKMDNVPNFVMGCVV